MLKGKTIGLRSVEKEDLPTLLEWRNRPEYRRYFREFRELSMKNQNEWYENIMVKDQRTIMFSIVELNGHRLLGGCGLCCINWIDRNADLSIYIGADNDYIDDTYAPDAAVTLVRYAFHELGLHRLWVEIYDFDEKKKCFFENLGFTFEGRHRQTHWTGGEWNDSLFFSLLSTEFEE